MPTLPEYLESLQEEELQEYFDAQKDIERYRRQAALYKSQYQKLLEEYADINNLIERMKDVLSTIDPQPLCLPERAEAQDAEEEMILLFSDAQIGAKSLGEEIGMVKPRVYGALGAYNFDIFRYRLRVWLQEAIRILRHHRVSAPVRKLNLWFVGDVLENEWIFRGQGAYIETGLIQQFFGALYEVGNAIGALAQHFKEIEIHGVAGNHGRGTKRRGESKTWVNWEWLWLRYLELICRDLPNVDFQLTMSWFDLPVVQGYKFLMLHGEDIRRYMRFPWYATHRLEKAYNELLGSVGEDFDYMVFGHHHVAASFQTSRAEWYCNGNWVGPTMFSMKVLNEMMRPAQWLFFCKAAGGIASRWLIDLLIEDEQLWNEVTSTAYDVHVPKSNQELLYAMQASARKVTI